MRKIFPIVLLFIINDCLGAVYIKERNINSVQHFDADRLKLLLLQRVLYYRGIMRIMKIKNTTIIKGISFYEILF